MGLLSAQMLAELQKPNPDVVVVLELGLPGGTRRFAKAAVESDSQGLYESRVNTFGTRTRGRSDRDKRLNVAPLQIELDNSDRWFNKILEGSSGDQVAGSSAVVKLLSGAASGVSYANGYTDYTGEIEDWDEPTAGVVTLSIRPPDRPLRRTVPRERITKADWPLAKADSYGKIVPQILGLFGSVGNIATGALPTYYVDTSAFRHLVCHGRVTILRAYKDGAQQTGNWSAEYLTRNGKLFTLVKWTSDPLDAVVTVDVAGYETVGDGSGTLITNPVRQLKHWLDQFVWGEYLGGNWLAATAPIDTTRLTETEAFLDAYSLTGSLYVSSETTGEDVLNDWCASHQVDAFWTNLGKIAFRVDDPRLPGTGYSGSWIRGDLDQVGRFGTRGAGRFLKDRVQVTYQPSPAGGGLLEALEVRDTSLTLEGSEALALAQGAAYSE